MKTYICGHRNPDTDSITSAYALADLRRRTGMENVEPICAGNQQRRWNIVVVHRILAVEALFLVAVNPLEVVASDVELAAVDERRGTA